MSNLSLNWIFNNCDIQGEYCYIHFPLIYLTKNQLSLQAYAESVKEFFDLLDLNIYLKIIDFGVAEFLEKNRINIQNVAIGKVYSIDFLNETFFKLKDIYQKFPPLCLEMERQILDCNKALEYNIFSELFGYLKLLIGINYFNSVLTSSLTAILNNAEYSPLAEKYLYKNNFSHMIYFNEELNKLNSDSSEQGIVDFCWNTAFAKDNIGDGCEYEEINFIKNLLNIQQEFDLSLKPSKLHYPEILPQEISVINNNAELILSWANLLQNNIEFRHYWGLRFLRNTKFLLNDKKDAPFWTFEDYGKNYFKIK